MQAIFSEEVVCKAHRTRVFSSTPVQIGNESHIVSGFVPDLHYTGIAEGRSWLITLAVGAD